MASYYDPLTGKAHCGHCDRGDWEVARLQANYAVGCDLFSCRFLGQQIAELIVRIICVAFHPLPMNGMWRKQFC